MKTIIAGSRDIVDMGLLEIAISRSDFSISEVVCGEAAGVDTLGRIWAEKNNIPVKSFPALWKRHGRKAGPIRNEQMGDYADNLLAVWDGSSPGTRHMINYMNGLRKPVFVLNLSHVNLFDHFNSGIMKYNAK